MASGKRTADQCHDFTFHVPGTTLSLSLPDPRARGLPNFVTCLTRDVKHNADAMCAVCRESVAASSDDFEECSCKKAVHNECARSFMYQPPTMQRARCCVLCAVCIQCACVLVDTNRAFRKCTECGLLVCQVCDDEAPAFSNMFTVNRRSCMHTFRPSSASYLCPTFLCARVGFFG